MSYRYYILFNTGIATPAYRNAFYRCNVDSQRIEYSNITLNGYWTFSVFYDEKELLDPLANFTGPLNYCQTRIFETLFL